MKLIFNLSIICLVACIGQLSAQSLGLSIPHIESNEGDEISLELSASSFENMVSVQFSIHWDPTIIQFEGSSIADLDFVAVGTSFAEEGTARISWFDVEGIGHSMEDGKSFLKLDYKVIGEVGDISPVSMKGDSLEIQIFQATDTPGVFEPIDLDGEDGSVSIIDENGTGTGTVTLNLNNTLVSDVACEGDASGSIDIEVNSTVEELFYFWTGPNGFTAETEDIFDLVGGEYNLQIKDIDGNVLLERNFNINQPLSILNLVEIQTQVSNCDGNTGIANINIQGGTPPYTFELGNGIVYVQSEIQNLAPGEYSLLISDDNGCTLESNFNIEQADAFFFDLGDDVNECEGQSVILDGGAYDEYLWSDGSTDPELEVNEEGLYTVLVTDENGCTAVDSIIVAFISNIELSLNDEEYFICPGDSVQLNVEGGIDYDWEDPTNTLSNVNVSNPFARPIESTTYLVSSEGDCGSDAKEVAVNVFQIVASAGPDVCVREGEEVQLNASGGEFYYWLGSEYPLNEYDIPNPKSLPLDSTTYRVMIIDENECTSFDEVKVVIAGEPTVFINRINIITPNGDGVNDVLDFGGNFDKYGTNTLKVFNRWGKIVYEKIDYQLDGERFDGTYKGEVLPAGAYYYTLSFRNEETILQTLTIIEE